MNNLSNKIAWVTGAAQSIGKEIVAELRRRGATVFATDIREAPEVEGCDMTDVAAISAYASSVIQRAGRIDILVNSDGIQRRGEFVTFPIGDFEAIFATNVRGGFFAAQTAAKSMVSTGTRGTIINIDSVNADRGHPEMVPYCGSKGAVRAMTLALAVSLGKYGIRVNSVAPGLIETELTRPSVGNLEGAEKVIERTVLGRLGQPADVAPAVAFLASDEANFMTGATIHVNGGWTLMA